MWRQELIWKDLFQQIIFFLGAQTQIWSQFCCRSLLKFLWTYLEIKAFVKDVIRKLLSKFDVPNFQKERQEKLWDPLHQVCSAETTRRLDQWDTEHPNPSEVGSFPFCLYGVHQVPEESAFSRWCIKTMFFLCVVINLKWLVKALGVMRGFLSCCKNHFKMFWLIFMKVCKQCSLLENK